MKIKCVDTRQARSNLEATVKLGRQHKGLFGYIERCWGQKPRLTDQLTYYLF